jgi:putative endopeptidase
MLTLLGSPKDSAEADARRIVALETAIARTSIPAQDARAFSRLYHPTARASLLRMAPDIDWTGFFSATAVGAPDTINVAIPGFIRGVDSLIRTASISDWRAYLRWHLATATAPALGPPSSRRRWSFAASPEARPSSSRDGSAASRPPPRRSVRRSAEST